MKLKNLLLAPAIGATAALLSPAEVSAQGTVCGHRSQIVKQLADRYGETALSRGVARGAGVVEIYVNPDSGSWTIVVTNPNGTSCLMAAGEAFEPLSHPSFAQTESPA
ncbi:MAG: hypothetical protein AAGE80_01885 [Pseudomonadota bacterium]